MVIPEEQPAQPALPIQPEGMRVVCGHCGNTFLVRLPTTAVGVADHRVRLVSLCDFDALLLFKYSNPGASDDKLGLGLAQRGG